MNRKQWLTMVLVAFFVGSIGSIIIGRYVIPHLAAVKGWESLNKLATNSPIVINRTQEIQLNEGVNLIDLTKQTSNLTVSFYSTDANPSYIGNGIIMTSDGLIFTSKAVPRGQIELTAVLNNGNKYKALVRAADPKSDIVAVTIDENNLNAPSFADAISLEVGQRLLAIGESTVPLNRSFSQGFVTNTVANASAILGRNFTTEVLENSFETDAAVNNGRFIGSPILNLNGKLVGMVGGTSLQKIVIAENLQSALNSYLSTGKIVRPVLGLSYFNISKIGAALKGLDRAGVLVLKADDGSPAAGKLLPNDLIFGVDGQSLDNQSFEQIVNRHSVGEIKFRILRAGKEMDVSVNLVPTK